MLTDYQFAIRLKDRQEVRANCKALGFATAARLAYCHGIGSPLWFVETCRDYMPRRPKTDAVAIRPPLYRVGWPKGVYVRPRPD